MALTPELLEREVRSRGVVILAVSRDPGAPDVLLVYLHGNAGQWVEGTALRLVAQVPGVVVVRESALTPTILLVQVAGDDAGRGD